MKHTELPWSVGQMLSGQHSIDCVDYRLAVLHRVTEFGENDISFDNAAFIVKAVNNHYQLIETIKNITLREKVATVIIDSFIAMKNNEMFALVVEKDYFSEDNSGGLKAYDDILEVLEKKVSIEQKSVKRDQKFITFHAAINQS